MSIGEILSSAANLSPADLRTLRREIERLEKHANAIILHPKPTMTTRLCRLSDHDHVKLSRRSLAIAEDYGFYMAMFSSMRHSKERKLNFAEVYLTLKHITGESGDFLDDYKMAFSFPFAMDVIRGENEVPYLLEVRNIRDSLYFSLRKVVEGNDSRLKDHLVHQPFADEFSRDEINYFISYFYGYLMGRWECLKDQPHEPFIRIVPSNLIVLGYLQGKAFEEDYASEEEFSASVERYRIALKQDANANQQFDPSIVIDKSADWPSS